jgi:hypothetical protein
MKRLRWLLFLVLVPLARATMYVITPGGTYATFHALILAKTLAAGDIVEYQAPNGGGVQSFLEPAAISPNGSGASGNPITIRGRAGDVITVDGAYSLGNCVFVNSRNWIVFQNLNFQNATGVGGIAGCVDFNNANNCSLINCTISVGFADVATANTSISRCGFTQSGQNLTMTGNYIIIGPGLWGSGQTDAVDLSCSGTASLCQYNTCVMHNACFGPYGGLDSSSVVISGGTSSYQVGDILNVTSDVTTGTSSGSYGQIQVSTVSGGPPGTLLTYTVVNRGVNYQSGNTYATSAATGTGSGATIKAANVPGNHNDCLQLLNCTNTTVDSNIMDRNVTNSLTLGTGQALISEYYNNASDVSPVNYGYAIFTNNVMFGCFGSNGATINSRHESGFAQTGIVNLTFANNLIDCFAFVGAGVQSIPMSITSTAGTVNASKTGIWSGGNLIFQNNIIINRNATVTFGGGIGVSAPYGSAAAMGNYGYPGNLGTFTSDYNHVYFTSVVNGSSVQVNIAPTASSTGTSSGVALTWPNWVAVPYDTHGIGYNTPGYAATWQTPGFVNDATQDYVLSPASADRTKGVTNANSPLKDINQRFRPTAISIGPSECWVTGLSAQGFAAGATVLTGP